MNKLETFDLVAFSRENLARCEASNGFNHPLGSWTPSDWMTAIVGELGEAANIVKKLNRARDGVPGNKETVEELRTALEYEVADAACYLDLFAQSMGIDLSSSIRTKFDIVSKRLGYVALPRIIAEDAETITIEMESVVLEDDNGNPIREEDMTAEQHRHAQFLGGIGDEVWD